MKKEIHPKINYLTEFKECRYMQTDERNYYLNSLSERFPMLRFDLLNDVHLMNIYDTDVTEQPELIREYFYISM